MTDLSFLGGHAKLWDEWRFTPWSSGSAEGLYRRVSLVKSGLLGEVARYYSDDYIIWKYLPEDINRLRLEAVPEEDLMLRRFVFLQTEGEAYYKKSSLMLGLRGFAESHTYTLGTKPRKDIEDLAYLANMAMKERQKQNI